MTLSKFEWILAGMGAAVAIAIGWSLGEMRAHNQPEGSRASAPSSHDHETTGSVDRPSASVPPPITPTATPKPSAAPPPSARAPASVEGTADVIDTVTLRIGGRVVRLYATEWARGGKAEDLTAYLAGRQVRCEPVEAVDTYRCRAGEQDLSRVVLFNGGARAAFDAPPELKDAEEKAKGARRGVWNVADP
jgi:endonuclease YncB( thermonuclease family)